MKGCRFNNWDKKCEEIVNKQIQIEYFASYQYHLMWSYFNRSDVALENIAKFYKKSAEEELEHAHNLMKYQNLRGGNVELRGIQSANIDFLFESDNPVLSCFKETLSMEQNVYENLLKVHKVGDECSDPQFTDFIEGEYLEEQVNALNEISKYVTELEMIGDDKHGIWHFDKNFFNK